jgi:hypothetical protein
VCPGALEIQVVGSELPAGTAQRWRAAGRHRSQPGRAGTGWCASSAASCDDRLRHGWARSGEADVQDEVPSLSLSTPPPAQCTMKASKMMARITTTAQEKNTTMPGMAYPASVLALATATSYPPPPSPGRGQRRHPCPQPPAPARPVRRSVRHRQHGSNHDKKPEAMHGRVLLPPPAHSPLRPAPPARKSHNHRARETGTTGAGPGLVRSMGARGICGWRTAGQPVVAALWPGSAGRYSVH